MATVPSSLQVVDDIAGLKSALRRPDLQYLDIATQSALKKALQRWPLFAELTDEEASLAQGDGP